MLKGYSDANYIYDANEMKSTNGQVFTLEGGAISLKFSKQICIAWSTKDQIYYFREDKFWG